MEFEIITPIKTAIPTLLNTFDSGFFWDGWWWWGECQRIKVVRSRVYPLGQLPTINPKYIPYYYQEFEEPKSVTPPTTRPPPSK